MEDLLYNINKKYIERVGERIPSFTFGNASKKHRHMQGGIIDLIANLASLGAQINAYNNKPQPARDTLLQHPYEYIRKYINSPYKEAITSDLSDRYNVKDMYSYLSGTNNRVRYYVITPGFTKIIRAIEMMELVNWTFTPVLFNDAFTTFYNFMSENFDKYTKYDNTFPANWYLLDDKTMQNITAEQINKYIEDHGTIGAMIPFIRTRLGLPILTQEIINSPDYKLREAMEKTAKYLFDLSGSIYDVNPSTFPEWLTSYMNKYEGIIELAMSITPYYEDFYINEDIIKDVYKGINLDKYENFIQTNKTIIDNATESYDDLRNANTINYSNNWSPGKEYNYGDTVKYNNNFFYFIYPTPLKGEPYKPLSAKDLQFHIWTEVSKYSEVDRNIIESLINYDNWNPTVKYNEGQVVKYLNKFYLLHDGDKPYNSGNVPTDTTFWKEVKKYDLNREEQKVFDENSKQEDINQIINDATYYDISKIYNINDIVEAPNGKYYKRIKVKSTAGPRPPSEEWWEELKEVPQEKLSEEQIKKEEEELDFATATEYSPTTGYLFGDIVLIYDNEGYPTYYRLKNKSDKPTVGVMPPTTIWETLPLKTQSSKINDIRKNIKTWTIGDTYNPGDIIYYPKDSKYYQVVDGYGSIEASNQNAPIDSTTGRLLYRWKLYDLEENYIDSLVNNIDITSRYNDNKDYKVNDLITLNNKHYVVIKDAPKGSLITDVTFFKELSGNEWESYVYYYKQSLEDTQKKKDVIASKVWVDNKEDYKVGDEVTYNGKSYILNNLYGTSGYNMKPDASNIWLELDSNNNPINNIDLEKLPPNYSFYGPKQPLLYKGKYYNANNIVSNIISGINNKSEFITETTKPSTPTTQPTPDKPVINPNVKSYDTSMLPSQEQKQIKNKKANESKTSNCEQAIDERNDEIHEESQGDVRPSKNRLELVKNIMKGKGMNMMQASHYVNRHKLYK
jgi:hypothetical protein